MANISRDLPSGRDILADPALAGAYGDHASTQVAASGVSLTARNGMYLASLAHDGESDVDLPALDMRTDAATLVAYVNAFLAGEGRVEKYWRTKTYRRVGQVGAPVQRTVAPTAPVATTTPVKEVPTVVTETTPEVTTVTAIAGVEVPKRVKVTKVRAKGWSRIGEVLVRDEHLDTLNDAWTLRAAGVPAATLITGPAGTAKTALARAFAASLGVPFLKIDGGAIRTADDWAGAFRQDPTTKVWSHRWSPFAQVLRLGEPCVVLVDEITRTESPQALNAFMGLLDWTGAMLVPDAHEVLRLPAGVLVIATANIGPEFVGTLPLDGAVRQRFPFGIRMAYPEETVEAGLLNDLTGLDADVCTRLVTMAVTQRANRLDPQQYPSGAVISTRVLLDIARRITTCNRDPRAAVISTLSGQFDPEDDAALSVAIDTQFPAAPIVEDEALTEAKPEEMPWTCPVCSRENAANMVVCWGHDCTYVRLTPQP